MHPNENLIQTFYTAFQRKDFKTMQNCYSDEASFTDPVFKNLNALQVRAMWEMLIKNGKDLQLEFTNIKANDHSGVAEWVANYTFSRSGNKVENRIKAEFIFKDGKILAHKDEFNFYRWARQALGLTGLLLGHTAFLKKKIGATAMNNLEKFMARQ